MSWFSPLCLYLLGSEGKLTQWNDRVAVLQGKFILFYFILFYYFATQNKLQEK